MRMKMRKRWSMRTITKTAMAKAMTTTKRKLLIYIFLIFMGKNIIIFGIGYVPYYGFFSPKALKRIYPNE